MKEKEKDPLQDYRPKSPWKCSTNHPDLTPQLRELLGVAFDRLAALNIKASITKLNKAETLERAVLRKMHDEFRKGRGVFKAFIGDFFDTTRIPV